MDGVWTIIFAIFTLTIGLTGWLLKPPNLTKLSHLIAQALTNS
jgi:hypothetical protein